MTTERIEIDPAIMMGKPVIRGTRITVELILRKLADGASESELLEDYPHLTTNDIRAAVAYGAASVAHEEVVLLPNSVVEAVSKLGSRLEDAYSSGTRKSADKQAINRTLGLAGLVAETSAVQNRKRQPTERQFR